MNRFKQHIPAFVDVDEKPLWHNFETTEDLLSLEIVKRYIGKYFSHFALSDNHLMEISDDGFSWWVVGYIEDPSVVVLPQWEGWKFRAEMPDGSRRILSKEEAMSICGDKIMLRNGSFARNLTKKEWMGE